MFTNAIKFTKDAPKRQITISAAAFNTQPVSGPHYAPYIPPRNSSNHVDSPIKGQLDNVFLQFAVEDTGRGLSEEELHLLFQRFGQASPKTYGKYGGSGLGLFISRQLTELQGGQIGVHSELGRGTTFFFYIKAQRYLYSADPSPKDTRRPSVSEILHDYKRRKGSADHVSNHTPSVEIANPLQTATALFTKRPVASVETVQNPSGTAQMHILVVEDNAINQRVLAQQLARVGCIVYTANHGGEALDFLSESTRAFAPSSRPSSSASEQEKSPSIPGTITPPELRKHVSIILLDIEMPVMDGIECITRIRTLEKNGTLLGHVPTIAVTANVRQEHIDRAKNAGMDSVVTKPFSIKDLMSRMKECIAAVSREEAGENEEVEMKDEENTETC
jgi:CheY-like chemotaxis protein